MEKGQREPPVRRGPEAGRGGSPRGPKPGAQRPEAEARGPKPGSRGPGTGDRGARPGAGAGTHRLVLILQAAGGHVRHGAAGLEEAAPPPPPCPGSRNGTSGASGSGPVPGPAACQRPGSASAARRGAAGSGTTPPSMHRGTQGRGQPLEASLIGCERQEACPPLGPTRSSP